MKWWHEIDPQLKKGRARIYVPDICIAEAFKTLANAYFHRKWFKSPQDYVYWRSCLRKDIHISAKTLRSQQRKIYFHDLPTCRDIIIAVDRFYEMFAKKNLRVSVPDIIIAASAKYLMDYFDIPKDHLHIITLDRDLRKLTKQINELPNAYDPTAKEDKAERIFQ
jgi:predicted nucleic acid-binding protein